MTDIEAQARVRTKLENVGDIRPTAVADFIDEFIEGRFVESNADEWIKKARADKPQRFLNAGTDALAIDAFVNGNLTARGTLSKQMTTAELDALAQTFGLKNFHDFRRGALPANAKPDANNKKPGDRKSPWLKDQWSLKAQGALVKSIGVEAAAGIAAAAGCRIGSTKPNSAYN
jgi:hypothetical protein